MTDVPENFSSHPVSLAEVRSDKTLNAAHWTPRDALISLLRDIDSGAVAPDTLVLCYSETNADISSTWFSSAAPNALQAIGTVQRALHRLNAAMDEADE